MAGIYNFNFEKLPKNVLGQPCVQALKNSPLPLGLKLEGFNFIKRNILEDCNIVPPRCLKAHLVKKAQNLGFGEKEMKSVKSLFRAKIGFQGYYLDNGKLKKV